MTGSLESHLHKNGSNPRRIIKALRDAQNSAEMPPSRSTVKSVKTHLRACIDANNLQPLFYNEDESAFNSRASRLVNKVLKTDFQNIANNWRGVSLQMAQRLCKLALYDIVLLVDDSSSIRTRNEDDGRLDDLEMIASILAEVSALFDDDGIDIEFLNNEEKYRGIREGKIASQILHDLEFRGKTKLGQALHQKVHRRFFHKSSSTDTSLKMKKPVLVFIITDGAPAGEPEKNLEKQIRKARKYLDDEGYPPDFFRYQIVQVGKNQKSSEFLQDLKQQFAVEEFVDVSSRYAVEKRELELMGLEPSPELYLVKLLLGAIDGRFY
ncbi:hypothetical protein BGZ96_011380 [Linnemannia gamsii]|uniref:VWFA domain-containing protein n=1 Tax=Linnemannia gamsii TaxID=64522 RepID=A0ABQ7JT34_9FUNG|nr:hypothetical protein BGZ96_011380 [Linnemannia gamsii]